MESYEEIYKRLGSHVRAKAYIRHKTEQEAEQKVQSADRNRAEYFVDLNKRRQGITLATSGPFRLPNPLERCATYELIHGSDDSATDDIQFLVRKAFETKVLSIQWKDLEQVPAAINTTLSKQMNDIRTIDLVGNKLKRLPRWKKKDFRRITEMNVSNNRLEHLADNIGCLDSLEICKLKHNVLKQLPDSICKLSRLRILELTGNFIGNLPSDIGSLVSLEVFRIGGNCLGQLPWSFQNLKFLRIADFDRNCLKTLALLQTSENLFLDGTSHPETAVSSIAGTEWQTVQIPGQGQMYYSKKTGKTQRHLPTEVKQKDDPWEEVLPDDGQPTKRNGAEIPKLNLSTSLNDMKVKRMKIINKRKAVLAQQKKCEWTCDLDFNTGKLVYYNHVFRKGFPEMPSRFDCFGKLERLTELQLAHNNLRVFPRSCSCLLSLRILNLQANSLTEISQVITSLPSLMSLNVKENLIAVLPAHISNLANLQKLFLDHNEIEVIPKEISELQNLEVLWLTHNKIKPGGLPSSMRLLKGLKDVNFDGNPVVEHEVYTTDEISRDAVKQKDMEAILKISLSKNRLHRREWSPRKMYRQGQLNRQGVDVVPIPEHLPALIQHFNEQHTKETRGPPPKPKSMAFGIADERRDIDIRYIKDQQQLIKTAQQTGVLSLQWRSLTRVPHSAYSLGAVVRELRLGGNQITVLPPEIEAFTNLAILEMRNNQLQSISARVGNIQTLQHLLLEDNKLTKISERLGKLAALELLALDGNQLVSLPFSLGSCTGLKVIKANVNKITTVPQTFCQLENLVVLQLSKNSITEFPITLMNIPSLRILHLNSNSISRLPDELHRFATLEELHISGNKLEWVQDEVCQPPLCLVLKSLWLFANRIVQLCDSFSNFSNLRDLRIDFNGMVSPPEGYVDTYGVNGVLEYCKIRGERMSEVRNKLLENEFEIDTDVMRIQVKNFVTGNTGFLTSSMIAEFEGQLDLYLNRDCIHESVNGTELMDQFIVLRSRQRYLFLQTLLQKFLVVMELLQSDRSICSYYYFNPFIKRRWGREDKLIGCYGVNLDAMFQDQESPPQQAIIEKLKYREANDRGGVLTFHEITFQGQAFTLTRKMLEDALDEFEDPYQGKISSSKEKVYFKQERQPNGDRATFLKKQHSAAVIAKLVYSDEETTRCLREKELIEKACKEAEETVEKWFETMYFPVKLKKEITRRKNFLSRTQDNQESLAKESRSDVQHATTKLVEAKERLKNFNNGKPFVEHGFKSAPEAETHLVNAQEHLEQMKQKLVKKKQEVKLIGKRAKQSVKAWETECKESVRKKLVTRARRYQVYRGRMWARLNNLRRPWDGYNGATFIAWNRYLDLLEREYSDMQEETYANNKKFRRNPDSHAKEAAQLRQALSSILERKEDIESIEKVYDHKPGWSSDDSDGESIPDEYEYVGEDMEVSKNEESDGQFPLSDSSDEDQEDSEESDEAESLSSIDDNLLGEDIDQENEIAQNQEESPPHDDGEDGDNEEEESENEEEELEENSK